MAETFVLPTALLSIGYTGAQLSDFADTPGYAKRLSDQSAFLAVAADFEGDGRIDQARMLRNVERGVAYFVVVLAREKIDTHIVKVVQLQDADNLGIRAAPPARAGGVANGLTIFALDGSASETFDLVDDDFAKRTSS